MTYSEALEFIHGALKFGSKLGLSNINRLLDILGRPDEKLKFIHIAGTNGKGTVTTALSSILTSAGYKVGCYTSPFVNFFEERIMICGEPISQNDLAVYTEKIKNAISKMENHPTEFEIVTAIAFLYFAEKCCDFVVAEVGLGGRLDATNAIKRPLCSVITSVSYDHTEYLGNKLSDIAAEKCGIIKEGVPVVVYPTQNPNVMTVIQNTCRHLSCEITVSPKAVPVSVDLTGSVFDFGDFKNLKFPLIGEHMIQNAATALSTALILRKSGVPIPDNAIYEGLADTHHTGRFEVISKNPLIIVDGAHNMSGITAFKNTTLKLLGGKKLVFIMGILSDKEYEKAIDAVSDIPSLFIAIRVNSKRALPAEDIAAIASHKNKNVYIAKDANDAILRAKEENPDAILTFGSLYMLGEFRKLCFS